MGNLGDGFRPDEYEPDDDDDFALLPNAWYRALCTEAELRETNAGDGSFINCRWDLLGDEDGKYEGRVVFSMITWENKNPKAVKIGRGQINTLCEINGIADLQDTAQLVTGNPVEIRVMTEKATEDYEAKNVVKRYRAPKGGGDKKPAVKAKPSSGGGDKKRKGKPWQKSA